MKKILILSGILSSAVFLLFAYQFIPFLMSPGLLGASREVFYELKPHEPPQLVARELQALGVVSDARLFYWYGRLTGKSKKFKAGDYRFTTAMRPGEVLSIVMSGISYGFPLTVPEGYRMSQVAELVEKIHPGKGARFLELCNSRRFIATLGFANPPASLEGYLFPDTYLVGRKTPEEEIAAQMVRHFHRVFTEEMRKRGAEMGFTENQIVTLASIIEKETGAPEERSLISSVFHNRLKKKMRLQSDPTVIYGIKNYDGNIKRRDLEAYTAYNTYRIVGLPIGPIANPGREALQAALFPAPSDYLYFVSHNDGTHEFTSTYERHREAVERFQLDPHAREGKSWRDLQKSRRGSMIHKRS